jgi:hypothetical protein
MNCFKCNGSYQKKHGKLEFNDHYVGVISLDDADYYECPKCADQLLPTETARLIENKRKELLEEYLQSQPIKDFLSVAETSESLKITRQALHKHKRINNGFIYQTMFSGNKVYLKKSIDLYKKKGDGRFLIKNYPLQEKFVGLQDHAHFGKPIWLQFVTNISESYIAQQDKLFDDKTTFPTKVSTNQWRIGRILVNIHDQEDTLKFNKSYDFTNTSKWSKVNVKKERAQSYIQ